MTRPDKPRYGTLPSQPEAEASLTNWGIDFLTVKEAVLSKDGSLFVADASFGHVFEHNPDLSAHIVSALNVVGVTVKRDEV